MLVVEVRYTYRLRPGVRAQRYLIREWGMCRAVWNRLVSASQDEHLFNEIALANGAVRTDLPTFGYAQQDKFLTRLRATTVNDAGERWLAEGSSVAQQQTVRDFAAARAKALLDRKNMIPVNRRRGLPRFKSRHTALASMNYTQRGFSLIPDPDTGVVRLRLPGGVSIPVVWSRELPSEPTSARVSQDSLGHWHVSFDVKIEHAPAPAPTDAEPVGVDWGIKTVAVTTDDAFDLPHAQHRKNAQARLGRYQRMMSRRRTPRGHAPTKGYLKAKSRAAKAHAKVARQRQDDGRKWARRLVLAHERIAVEDFTPKFMSRNRSTAARAADAAIGAIKQELLWQATKHGRDLRLVNPAFTTMDCSACGARAKHRLPLSERTYTCTTCGLVKDRDKNSAAVIVARAGFVPASVEGVSPDGPAVDQPAA